MLADYHSLCSWLRCRVTTRFGCLRQLVIQIKETTTFFANSTAIIVDMLVLTICATHGLVVPLNKNERSTSIFFSMRLHLCTFLIGSVPNPVEHTVTKMLLSYHRTNFTSSLRSMFLPTAAQISPRLLFFFISLIGTNRHFFLSRGAFYQIVSYIQIVHQYNFCRGSLFSGVAKVAKGGDTRGGISWCHPL